MMFSKVLTTVTMLAGIASASTTQYTKRLSNSLAESLGIKSDSMISYDSIYFGYAPSYDPSVTMAALNKATGQKAATYNVYSQITSSNVNSGSYNGNDQYPNSDIISSGAVLIASLMPYVDWSEISTGLCASVAEYFENVFTSQGVTVWLRFAHEMNYYSAVGTYPGGLNYAEFMTAWKNMYNAIKGNDKIFMFWSPNDDTSSEPASPWWPGKAYVDIVGMDYYPNADDGLPTFASAYGNFYNTYALENELPFAIGETGTQLSSGGSASTPQKEQWLKTVIDPSAGFGSYSEYYVSCTWFEYGPPANSIDYYVVYAQSSSTITGAISNTENGS